ncbi:hypothetical protein [Streptomyces sp. S465]|uniref:hypothetical protein n=1 Tax=Streptomyces sp. S465 TaxID=2979468 RepID=UPI0022A88993|nr:hypothetical protein [Streptomyces sp. S465]WAP57030.1 hypothetical protein N6H00_19860 [Streptomyces sp. S465]
MQSVATQIQNALHQSSPEAAIRDVKHVMARELQSLDPKTEIKSTDYFNHTFVPDFVLTWGSGNQRPTRDVYLRFSVDTPLIQRDLKSLHEEAPAFISIGRNIEGDDEAGQLASQYDNCLLSSATALEAISNEDSRTPVTQMLKSSLLQGGKGYLIGEAAGDIHQAVSRTDSALASLDVPQVSATVRAMNEHFSHGFATRIERVMQVLWISQGGDAQEFPGTLEADTALSASELTQILPFLLPLEEISNIEFWRSLGENLDLGHLQSLEHWKSSFNLNLLINANLDRIKAKGVALDQVELNLFDDPDAAPYWEIVDSQLRMRCGHIDCRFVDDLRKTAHRTAVGRAPRWFAIEQRLDRYGIEGIEFTSPVSKTRIQSSTTEGLRESTDMRALSEALGKLARVVAVELRLPNSRDNVEINFDRAAVDAVGTSLSAHVLAHLGLDLLYQSTQETLDEFRRFVSVEQRLPWWRSESAERLTDQAD